jgi:SAM-dependent methyltransferase
LDSWKFFDITHRDHVICNPLSVEKVDELVQLLDLPAGARVLDIACGKAEILVRTVERYGCTGIGVDLSPFAANDARALADRRVPGKLEIVEQDGAAFQAEPASFDLSMCVGASWTFGGHEGTLRALAGWVRPGGLIVAGEPFWKKEPPADYLEAGGMDRSLFADHHGNVTTGLEQGLTLLYTLVSSDDDWDRYQGLNWRAAEQWAAANPDDPDRETVLTRMRNDRDRYLRWERDLLGWAVYVFRR